MRLLREFGACDCHSHVYGPYDRYPLSPSRTFDPPESPIEALESVWQSFGIDRAVVVQGSASGFDHEAMLAAIARDPGQRRGVAVVPQAVSEEELADLHQAGVRGIRFNWARHLLARYTGSTDTLVANASRLAQRVFAFGWHAELHIDPASLHLVQQMELPAGMPLVIDHMGRIESANVEAPSQLQQLLALLERKNIWVKLSGADRMASDSSSLHAAKHAMTQLLSHAPDRCVWGIDWPHVNLTPLRPDADLVALLSEVLDDATTRQMVLIANPERLYGFSAAA